MMNKQDFQHIDVDKLGIELPNLDGFSDPKDLECCCLELQAISATLIELQSYAETKQFAIVTRLKGDIDYALRCEQVCDMIAKRLPDWAKW